MTFSIICFVLIRDYPVVDQLVANQYIFWQTSACQQKKKWISAGVWLTQFVAREIAINRALRWAAVAQGRQKNGDVFVSLPNKAQESGVHSKQMMTIIGYKGTVDLHR